jgi:lupus La protein
LTTFNKDGWVPIETILTFKRMREFETYGVPFVVEALKKVVEAEGRDPLLAIDEQAGNVRRIRPMEAQSDAWTRSVYVVSQIHDALSES